MAPTEQIEFSQSVEGLFIKGLGSTLTPVMRDQLRAKGLDLDRPLRPGYPAADLGVDPSRRDDSGVMTEG